MIGVCTQLLIVEDDDISFLSIQRAVKRVSPFLQVSRAVDGVEALEMLRGLRQEKVERPLIILLDINMPRMGGIAFLERLRSDPDLASSIVFVLTTSETDADIRSAYSYNVAGYIVKSHLDSSLNGLANTLNSYWRAVTLPV